jgi:hypothetical protein
MTPNPHWTSYVSALTVPVIALIGAGIAFLQWRLAQNKLKLDLFDRRFKIYEGARELLRSVMTSGKAKDDEVFNFLVATREAKWLFDDSIAEYLEKEIYHKAVDLQTLDAELVGVPVGEKRTKNVTAQRKLKEELLAQFKVLDEKFTPYLRLRHEAV